MKANLSLSEALKSIKPRPSQPITTSFETVGDKHNRRRMVFIHQGRRAAAFAFYPNWQKQFLEAVESQGLNWTTPPAVMAAKSPGQKRAEAIFGVKSPFRKPEAAVNPADLQEKHDSRLDDLQDLLDNADKVTAAGHTSPDNAKRHGCYVSIQTGLSSQLWFVGLDLDGRTVVAEPVG
jgi:hypothetical protein